MIGAALASACRLISGPTIEWRCNPYADGPRIYFGNHSSHLDFIVIWSALPAPMRQRVRPVAGRDYWERGAVRRYLARDVFRAVLVDRRQGEATDAIAAARASVERVAREMDHGASIIVFPEGTRSADGEIGRFKSGLFHLARAKPDAELIPVYLENLNRILPKGETLPVPMLSRVIFGPGVRVGADEDKDDFLGRARHALRQLGSAS
jgi:1-acyl-sn-glycerol-3-phosphate acyltransferase